MDPKLSNSVDTQDTLQDVGVFNSYIHYIGLTAASDSGDETGELLDGVNAAFEIPYASEFNQVKESELFDRYSDYYLDKANFGATLEDGDTQVTPM